MPSKEFLHDYAIQFVVLAIFAWMLRPRKSIQGSELTSTAISLKTHMGMRILAIFVGLLGLLFLFISSAFYFDPDGVQWGMAIPCTLFSLAILYWVVQVFTLRVEADENGVRYSAGLKRVIATWPSVDRIEWHPRRTCHVITTQNGKFSISSSLEGVALYLRICSGHRPDLFQVTQINPFPANDPE